MIGTTSSNLDIESVPTNGAKLMKRNFVSQVMCTQMDPDSGFDTCMIKGTSPVGDDHQCGVCHNTSDAKDRIELLNKYGIIKNAQLSLSFKCYILYLFMAVWRVLYTLLWVLAIVVLMSPLGNTSYYLKGALMYLQRFAQLVS